MKRFLLACVAATFFVTACSSKEQALSVDSADASVSSSTLASTTSGVPENLAFDDPALEEFGGGEEKTSSSKKNDTPRSGSSINSETTQTRGSKPSIEYRDVSLPATSWVATARSSNVDVTDQPDGIVTKRFPNPTQFGGPRVFRVLDLAHPTHVKVSLPSKPNGQEGWVLREAVTLEEIDFKALVDLRNNSLTVWDGDEIIVRTQAVTGKARTPTPLGTFYVRDIIKKPNAGGAYGPYIVALSGFSETLETFAGGLPAIAIHGTNQPGLIGQNRSNGCIRIPNDLITQLAGNVPLGTPVTVVA